MITFDEQVAIVTGAGQGLGRQHALALAARGAKVVINDLGGARDGSGSSATAAEAVVAEIEAAGGEAMANAANVTDREAVDAMVAETIDRWGRIDILINNAGILRDRSFAKMSPEEWSSVIDVHLHGTGICTHAVWGQMREQSYGRIMVTSSSSGLYGNFGQANYGAAKLGVVGMMNTLKAEGAKYDIRVNALAPIAHTRMTDDILPEEAKDLLDPADVTPGVLFLVSKDAPSGVILAAGAGGYSAAKIYETDGIWLAPEDRTPENIAARFEDIVSPEGQKELSTGTDQTMKFVSKAMQAGE